jgi:hypothetical protein
MRVFCTRLLSRLVENSTEQMSTQMNLRLLHLCAERQKKQHRSYYLPSSYEMVYFSHYESGNNFFLEMRI